MRLIYIGPHDGVEVPLPDGRHAVIERGQPLDTTDTHAAQLLEQPSNWDAAKPETKPAKKPADEKEG